MVLGQLPRGKLSPNPKTNPNQTLNLTEGQFSSGAIMCLPPTLKLPLTMARKHMIRKHYYNFHY